MSIKPLTAISGLAIGDYLLWNWSLSGHHDVLALVSGLTLPPVVIVWVWLVGVALARVLAAVARRARGAGPVQVGSVVRGSRRVVEPRQRQGAARGAPASGDTRRPRPSPSPASSTPASQRSSRRLAA